MGDIFFASLDGLFFSAKWQYAGSRLSVLVGLALFALAFTSASSHAQPSYLSFQSALSGSGQNWCIDITGGKYQPGTPLQLSTCTGTANQTFNTEGGLLTAGGLCLDARGDAAQSTVTMAECSGETSQTWQISGLSKRPALPGYRQF